MIVDVESVIVSELQPREKVLWTGRPAQGIRLRPADTLLIPFSLLWGGFAIFWEWKVLTQSGTSYLPFVGVLFVLIGLYLIFGRFYYAAWQRARTRYALTSERAIIVCGRETRSLYLRQLESVTLLEGRNSVGSVILGEYSARHILEWMVPSWGAGTGWPGSGPFNPPRFDLIENAPRVHELILSALRKPGG
jgi:hypothetical protein